MNNIITCPHCREQFEISDAINDSLKITFREEALQSLRQKESELDEKQAALRNAEKAVQSQKLQLENLVNEKVKVQLDDINQKAMAQAQSKVNQEMARLQKQLLEKDTRLSAVHKKEQELNSKMLSLENEKKTLAEKMKQKLQEERQKMQQETIQKIHNEHNLKDKEKDNLIARLKEDINDIKMKMDQGNIKVQGSVLEEDLADSLQKTFAVDIIKPVLTGHKGADIIHTILNPSHKVCGKILWEAKNAKTWQNSWIDKLKQDQDNENADLVVLVSQVLPKDMESFGNKDGIWICDYSSVIGLAAALREMIIRVDLARQSAAVKDAKLEALYQYLSGAEFSRKVKMLIETAIELKHQLDKEKRTIQKQWAIREQLLNKIAENTITLTGNIQGVTGTALPEVESLMLGE